MNLTPTPVTAALAGGFSAWAFPAVGAWLGSGAAVSAYEVLAFLLLVALPAHAGVLGLRRPARPGGGGVDKPLLVRVGAWLAAAAVVSAVTLAAR